MVTTRTPVVEIRPHLRCPECHTLLAEVVVRHVRSEERALELIQCPLCHATVCAHSQQAGNRTRQRVRTPENGQV
jgi:hypothetical protein